jgi:hypothetical protein
MKRIQALIIAMTCVISLFAQTNFPLPQIPETMTQPEERLTYLVNHYWDYYQFNDTTQVNQDLGEQGFADFINILGYGNEELMDNATKLFYDQAFSTNWGKKHYSQMINHYLDNPNSPLRNDIVYVHFLRNIRPYYANDAAARQRYTFKLTQAKKNLPGQPAADFTYLERDGRQGKMSDIQAKYTLLFFHDPDCENCKRIMPLAIQENLLQRQDLKVLVIYADKDYEAWKKDVHSFPANWIDAYSANGEIMQKLLYFLPATPSFYLLDTNKKVILKDAPLDTVLAFLQQN